jgi:hypothetical protein
MHAALAVGATSEGLSTAASLEGVFYWRHGDWKAVVAAALARRPACALLMLHALDDRTR